MASKTVCLFRNLDLRPFSKVGFCVANTCCFANHQATTNVVDLIKEVLEEDRNIAVFFLYVKTPRSDDDGKRGLRYPDY